MDMLRHLINWHVIIIIIISITIIINVNVNRKMFNVAQIA